MLILIGLNAPKMTRKLIAFFCSFALFAVNVLNSLYYFGKGYLFLNLAFLENAFALCVIRIRIAYLQSLSCFLYVDKGRPGGPFRKACFLIPLRFVKRAAGRPDICFKNIAGN